jgi:hypothetical protein
MNSGCYLLRAVFLLGLSLDPENGDEKYEGNKVE